MNITNSSAISGNELDVSFNKFDDIQTQLIGQKLESPSSHIEYYHAEGSVGFDASCSLSDYVTMSIQMSHKWKIGSVILPHLHWWQGQTAMPNWLLQYRWQINGQLKETSWTYLPWYSNTFTWTTGTLNQITKFSQSGVVVPPTAYLSDVFQVRLLRDITNASLQFLDTDKVAGIVYPYSFDLHFEMDSLGSTLEYTK